MGVEWLRLMVAHDPAQILLARDARGDVVMVLHGAMLHTLRPLPSIPGVQQHVAAFLLCLVAVPVQCLVVLLFTALLCEVRFSPDGVADNRG
jgi:hypothetical protein